MRITFHGAAGCVTGSRFLVEGADQRILVDCGLFQGYKHLRVRNRRPFPVKPSSIDAVVLTHAHLDHSGYLPALVRDGFHGPIHCSPATEDLARILLPDSGRIQEEDARQAAEGGYSRHDPPLPLYTEADADRALKRFRPLATGQEHDLGGLRVRLVPNGHILGSCCVVVVDEDERVVFTGDLGRANDAVMPAPEPVGRADRLVLESTYGDRRHESESAEDGLARLAGPTLRRGATVLIPTFAVGRAQSLMVLLHRLMRDGRLPRAPVVLDSPMAVKASRLLFRHPELVRLDAAECGEVEDGVEYTSHVSESIALAERRGPMVLLSASGMLTGGRVLHHLKRLGPHRRHAILFAGYQAGGTRGGHLLAGHTSVKVHGRQLEVKAKVAQLPNLSAHADYLEIGEWLDAFPAPPRRTHLVHGEPAALDALRFHLGRRGWRADVAEMGDSVAG